MTEAAFARGAIDLTGLGQSGAVGAPSGAYLVELTEANFEATLRQSVRFPVVIEFYSPRDPAGAKLSQALKELSDEAAGSWLLARFNIDSSAQIAQALQIRAVPTVVGVINGQLVPLWQGTLAKEEAGRYLQELLKVAVANGLIGKAEPVVPEVTDDGSVDPRYAPAYDAMERADFAEAVAEFGKLLALNPQDVQAKVGKAQAGLLTRVSSATPQDVAAAQAAAESGDIEATLRAADLEVATGQPEAGFARLIAGVAATSGADRDRLRARLLELFDTLDPADPAVLSARRNLATALF